MVNYEEELKRLQESGNYWKPKVGQFKLKALSELEEAEPFVRKSNRRRIKFERKR